MLARVFAADYGQPLADSRSNHKRVCCAEAILIRLRQRKIFEVESKLANIWRLLDGHLARVCAVVAARVARIHKGGLVLVRLAAASELCVCVCFVRWHVYVS